MPNTSTDTRWYALPVEEVAARLEVDPARGLSAAEVLQRREQYGKNRLAGKKKVPGWRKFLEQHRKRHARA